MTNSTPQAPYLSDLLVRGLYSGEGARPVVSVATVQAARLDRMIQQGEPLTSADRQIAVILYAQLYHVTQLDPDPALAAQASAVARRLLTVHFALSAQDLPWWAWRRKKLLKELYTYGREQH